MPTLTSKILNEMNVFFKCKSFWKVSTFKFRGACNAVFSPTDDEAKRGVATHSSGNHATAPALSGRLRSLQKKIKIEG
jgi:threonine dehydratase|tara:strand:+ start:1695 stop:1928 length:234 start_codon:yes stop_codon:yes gene_type:complete